jgi:hypothetical protein
MGRHDSEEPQFQSRRAGIMAKTYCESIKRNGGKLEDMELG